MPKKEMKIGNNYKFILYNMPVKYKIMNNIFH